MLGPGHPVPCAKWCMLCCLYEAILHFLDDQRKFATFIYIRPRFVTSCSTFPKLWQPPTLTIRLSVRNTFDDRCQRSHRRTASGKKPPQRSIGQEATATQNRAWSHRHAASGKKPPSRCLQLAAFNPRTHDFHVHPSYLPSAHKFEFQLFVSTIRLACG